MSLPPDQFYSGLVAELYEPLASGLPDYRPYQRFIDQYGGPTLELGCGSGLPLLDLLELGYEVDGLDASEDMLRVCREKAEARGLAPRLYQGLFQDFKLENYQSIYIASASFTLLVNDEDALAALKCIRRHLKPCGALFLPLEVGSIKGIQLHEFAETTDETGAVLRVGIVDANTSDDGRNTSLTLRYERHPVQGETESLERVWQQRFWNEDQIEILLEQAGFASWKILPRDQPKPRSVFTVIAEV